MGQPPQIHSPKDEEHNLYLEGLPFSDLIPQKYIQSLKSNSDIQDDLIKGVRTLTKHILLTIS